ncbi:arginine biosynthesis bifunctional chloroplastic [Chlorella sorokiniana]|uniref:Arginine biosynthesis bifunctional chloroplastic n=1 Tax=Chlorella sorokiniana TaxID=3076 RepID=A0A2P6U2N8_CHLSO|nr:arginine biosynthesis bifunctional chloroplastic [Chlorella sorokiniana]|eukprot:PRW60578.1 arginine biosynthesis bifunctional chloroplastic [Chlorella sorokiniana]
MHAGLRPTSRRADAALLCSDRPATTADHFSANVLAGASVALSHDRIDRKQQGRAILMHQGAANVGTEEVLLQSAGALGQRVPLDRLLPALLVLAAQLGASAEHAFHAAVACTDRESTTKEAALEVALGGLSSVRLGGMAHASLSGVQAAITCDAAVHPGVWRAMFARAAADSFGLLALCEGACLNDSVLGLANGAARNPPILEPTGAAAVRLEAALTALMQGLAMAVAWDTSRAGCLIEVAVQGADSTADARQVALAVARSGAVRDDVRACRPSWGAIACALGASGVPFCPSDVAISIAGMPLLHHGRPTADLAAAKQYASEVLHCASARPSQLTISVRIGAGNKSASAWAFDWAAGDGGCPF